MKHKLNLKTVEKALLKDTIEVGEINGNKIIFNPNISCEKLFAMCEQIVNSILFPDGTYLPELRKLLIFLLYG